MDADRERLIDALDRYERRFPKEGEVIERCRRFCRSFPDCFERSCVPGHFTGSAWLLDQGRSHALLIHHRKLDRWMQPGGHADGSGDLESVARREAEEETGVSMLELVTPEIFDIDIHLIPGRGDVPEHLHYDIRYVFSASREVQILPCEEVFESKWFTLHEVLLITKEESVARMVRKSSTIHA